MGRDGSHGMLVAIPACGLARTWSIVVIGLLGARSMHGSKGRWMLTVCNAWTHGQKETDWGNVCCTRCGMDICMGRGSPFMVGKK